MDPSSSWNNGCPERERYDPSGETATSPRYCGLAQTIIMSMIIVGPVQHPARKLAKVPGADPDSVTGGCARRLDHRRLGRDRAVSHDDSVDRQDRQGRQTRRTMQYRCREGGCGGGLKCIEGRNEHGDGSRKGRGAVSRFRMTAIVGFYRRKHGMRRLPNVLSIG